MNILLIVLGLLLLLLSLAGAKTGKPCDSFSTTHKTKAERWLTKIHSDSLLLSV